MLNIIYKLNLFLLTLIISFFQFNNERINNSSKIVKGNSEQKTIIKDINVYDYDAFIFYNGSWRKGKIWIKRTQRGYKLLRYNFDIQTNTGKLQGRFNPRRHRLVKLNPNNNLAKKNNFTHYIKIKRLRAYLTFN